MTKNVKYYMIFYNFFSFVGINKNHRIVLCNNAVELLNYFFNLNLKVVYSVAFFGREWDNYQIVSELFKLFA